MESIISMILTHKESIYILTKNLHKSSSEILEPNIIPFVIQKCVDEINGLIKLKLETRKKECYTQGYTCINVLVSTAEEPHRTSCVT